MNFRDLNFGLEPPSHGIPKIGPPRRINLKEEEARKVHDIIEIFESSGIDIESLYNLFHDWQASKTKSIKKFVLSISFILTLTLMAGVEIIDIDLFGVSVAEGYGNYFLMSVLIIHLSSFFYFLYLKSIDRNIQQAKIITIESDLYNFAELSKEIDKIVDGNNLKSAEILFNDFRDPMLIGHTNVVDVYDAIKFYQERLKKEHNKYKWGEIAENIVIFCLGLAGVISIIKPFF